MDLNKYKLEITQKARQELFNILEYISHDLNNDGDAQNFYTKFRNALDNICMFPHSAPLSNIVFPFEIRKLLIDNYVAFYRVIDDNQTVVLYRLRYAKSDLSKLF